MERILVTYATNSGTTADVARSIGEEIAKSGATVETLPLEKVTELAGYTAVVLGAPMIMGWHRAALRFLRKNQQALGQLPLAIFITAVSLTTGAETSVLGVPAYIDAGLAKPSQKPGRLTLKERYANPANYARPILKAAPSRPVSIAFFGGRLDFYRLKWWQALFVMLIIQAQPGDRRDWDVIRSWAGTLPALLEK